jgi:hypothetical protein
LTTFTYEATNPFHVVMDCKGVSMSSKFRDTVRAENRFAAQKLVQHMGLTNVRVVR